MAGRYSAQNRELLRELRAIEREHRAFRAEIRSIERRESGLYRRLESLLRAGKPSHLKLVEHRSGKKDRITRHPLDSAGALTALATGKGSSGLFCGCRLILTTPQRDGSLDVCVLISCSTEPDKFGVRCSYWCFTFELEPVVAVASKGRQTGRNQGEKFSRR